MSDPSEPRFVFETATLTDVGCVRKVNEDSLLAAPESGLWLVADGMGGHAAGDFASQSIVAAMQTVGIPNGAIDLRARFMDRLIHANEQILEHASDLGNGTIGSTVAALLVQQGHFATIWSGDSRVYRLRGGVLGQMTRDHTEVRALLDAGTITAAEAEAWPRKNVITRAIGVTAKPECDIHEGVLQDKDLFLICSDGLTEYFHDDELERVMVRFAADLNALCAQLVATALERGGKDNVSIVAVRCNQVPLPEFQASGVYPEFGGYL
ncbi:PP2C family serine/threonine-protein phosphatase [Nereida sp. MMG025]|uniref:PP2C family protein-serine/threonine phosphatase n=1 Tax=Nereida sp. MMG025 TaxID=2909981 RepID=UPI001F3221EE|nr:protein phosphatase 2C domain-containing protein [Nereida sp. MMG025]MCF6445752.1 protein phosphatase 2C domain-containing protein [Nereida sp. MMG025]